MTLWRLPFHMIRLLLLIPVPGHGEPYILTECNSDGNFDIVQNQQPVLTCTGLTKMQNISWSFRNSSSGKDMIIGTCGDCKGGGGCPGCSPPEEGYNISRYSNDRTTLQFLNHSLVTSGSTIKCSNLRNKFNATCTLFVVPEYRMFKCRAGAVMVIENNNSPITCEGLLRAQTMYWVIMYANGTVSTIAECKNCLSTNCPKCDVTDTDFMVTRERNSSTLVIQNNVRQKDGATLTCSKKDNATHIDCKILVVSLDLNQERATRLPVAAVAGSVVGFVVIVAIAIFIVVILKRRMSKREATGERRDTVPLEDEFEKHINEFYQRADDPDLPRHSPHNSLAPLPFANTSVDPQGAGSDGAQNHVYAQVNKGKKEQSEDNKDKPGKVHVKQLTKGGQTQKHADTGDKGGPSPEEQGAAYTECVSDNKEDNSVTNVYMNVDESPPLRPSQDTQEAKKDSGNEDLHDPDLNPYHNTETTRHQGDYTNVQLELHDGEGVTKTAETDDEYRHLQLARPEQLDENPTYNHLEGV